MIENMLAERTKWKNRARTVLLSCGETDAKTPVGDLEEMIAKGEKLAVACEEVDALKESFLRYKTWLAKFENSGTVAGSTTNLSDLVREGKSLVVDVSEQIDVINANTKAYCICRLHYHGDMIGCDVCDDWYHLPCVGISPAQAENIGNYVCIRCCIGNSFKEHAVQAYKTTNAWLDLAALKHAQKLKVGKHQKKLTLAQNSAKRMEAELKLIGPLDAGSAAADTTVAEAVAPDPLSRSATLSNELLEANEKVEKIRREGEALRAQCDFEIANRPVVLEWMKEVQELLVPDASTRELSGRPILSPGDLPSGFSELLAAAKAINIDCIDDVLSIIDSSRWMTWCYCCLYALRYPMTSTLLRFMLQSVKSIRNPDEKIVKFLNGISTRSATWKSKVKKLAGKKYKGDRGEKSETFDVDETAPQVDESLDDVSWKKRTVDASKVVYLHQDSALIPINSRLKPMIKRGLDACHADLIEKGETTAADSIIRFHQGQDIADGAPGRRGAKKAILELANVFISLDIPEAFSSDDEDVPSVLEEGGSEPSKNAVLFLALMEYQKKIAASIASAPDPYSHWPVDKALFLLENKHAPETA